MGDGLWYVLHEADKRRSEANVDFFRRTYVPGRYTNNAALDPTTCHRASFVRSDTGHLDSDHVLKNALFTC